MKWLFSNSIFFHSRYDDLMIFLLFIINTVQHLVVKQYRIEQISIYRISRLYIATALTLPVNKYFFPQCRSFFFYR